RAAQAMDAAQTDALGSPQTHVPATHASQPPGHARTKPYDAAPAPRQHEAIGPRQNQALMPRQNKALTPRQNKAPDHGRLASNSRCKDVGVRSPPWMPDVRAVMAAFKMNPLDGGVRGGPGGLRVRARGRHAQRPPGGGHQPAGLVPGRAAVENDDTVGHVVQAADGTARG